MAPSNMGKSKAKGVIAVFLRDVTEAFYHPFITTIEHIADAMGYGVLFVRKQNSAKQRVDYMSLLTEQCNGFIFLGEETCKLYEMELLQAMGKPFVVVQGKQQVEGVSYLNVDNAQASFDAVSYLYKLGHRRIVHVTAPMYYYEVTERSRGYEEAIKSLGLEYQQKIHIDTDYDAIYDMGCRMGEMIRNERLTAAYCYNNLIATGIIDGLTDQGIRVPENFSVIGFDDVSFRDLSRNWIPMLSSVKQPQEAMAAYAVEKVVDMIDNGMFNASKVFKCEFIDRDSVRMI